MESTDQQSWGNSHKSTVMEYTDEYFEQNKADNSRRDIVAALNGTGPAFDRTLGMFMNGDWEPIYVVALPGSLNIVYEDMNVYGSIRSYQMHDNRLLESTVAIESFIYHLARILTPSWIEAILNRNSDMLQGQFVMFIDDDPDRGYLPMMVYRLNHVFNIIEPNGDGVYVLDREFALSLVPFSEYDSLDDMMDDHDIELE